MIWCTGAFLLCILFLSFDSWGLIPHYTVPAIAATVIPGIAGLRFLTWRLRATGGRVLPGLVLAISAIVCVIQLPAWRQDERDWSRRRDQILHQLRAEPGRQILIVPDEFSSGGAYVYNPADWRAAEVLMARDLGPQTVPDLTATFPDRRLWILTPDPSLSWPTPVPISRE
jgi:hypothetical protein